MRELSPFNFGLLVAYLVPGFVFLWGAGYENATVRAWLATAPDTAPTVGGLLYATLVSVACGMAISALRWAIIDTLHHRTGIKPPPWDFSLLQEKLEAYRTLIEIHYRYYQAHSNVLLAIIFAYTARFVAIGVAKYHAGLLDLAFVVVVPVLFLGSRDAMRKYYLRTAQLLGEHEEVGSHRNRGNVQGAEAIRDVAPKSAGGRAALPTGY